jgi:hypothetical protein
LIWGTNFSLFRFLEMFVRNMNNVELLKVNLN